MVKMRSIYDCNNNDRNQYSEEKESLIFLDMSFLSAKTAAGVLKYTGAAGKSEEKERGGEGGRERKEEKTMEGWGGEATVKKL